MSYYLKAFLWYWTSFLLLNYIKTHQSVLLLTKWQRMKSFDRIFLTKNKTNTFAYIYYYTHTYIYIIRCDILIYFFKIIRYKIENKKKNQLKIRDSGICVSENRIMYWVKNVIHNVFFPLSHCVNILSTVWLFVLISRKRCDIFFRGTKSGTKSIFCVQ